MSQFHEVGKPFSFDGTMLMAVEILHGSGCHDCYCRGEQREEVCLALMCGDKTRPDHKQVKFQEVWQRHNKQ